MHGGSALSFLSLVFWNSLVNFKQGISLVIFSVFSGFSKVLVGSAGDRNPWLI